MEDLEFNIEKIVQKIDKKGEGDYKICRVEREKGGEEIIKGLINDCFLELRVIIFKIERVYI